MAWTITATMDEVRRIKHHMAGDTMYVLKLACVSDASGGTITLKSTKADPSNSYNELMDQVTGTWLYLMEVVPGAGGDAPTAAFDIDVENKRNSHVLDTDSNSNAATSFTIGSATLGVYPPIMEEITVAIGTLGNLNTADVYLYFLK
jgi:hypothetical protein